MDRVWRVRGGWRTRTGRVGGPLGLAMLVMAVTCLGLLIGAGAAAAKSGSTPIPTPSPTQQIFSVSLAGQSYDYTWADVSGTGALGSAVTQSYLKDTAEQDPQDWTGIWLRGVLSDVEAKSGITLDADWRLKVSTVDAYACGLFVGDVQDAANNYLLAMDPVRGCDTEDPANATVWYDPTYVRICTNGDYGNSAFPARLVSTSGSMTVLDAGGHEINAPATASLVVTSPTVSQSHANVARGAQLELRAVATKEPTASQAEPVVWTSGDAAMAAVSQTGTVTANTVGTVVIRATSGRHAVDFTVMVVAKALEAKRVTLPRTMSFTVGTAAPLAARLYPSGATSTISWKSANAKVASVDRTGRVTAVRKGKVTITVRTSNGKTATCSITVR